MSEPSAPSVERAPARHVADWVVRVVAILALVVVAWVLVVRVAVVCTGTGVRDLARDDRRSRAARGRRLAAPRQPPGGARGGAGCWWRCPWSLAALWWLTPFVAVQPALAAMSPTTP
jgi:hypothetical protein